MSSLGTFVSTAEAAFIAGLSDRDMNRVVDEDILPNVLFHASGGRSFARLGAAFASFYFGTEDMFAAQFRRKILRELTARLEARADRELLFSLTAMPRDADWHIDVAQITRVDIAGYVQAALGRTKEIEQAHTLVGADPERMGGQAVFTGTRLPIDNILSSLDLGVDMARLQASYPFLTDQHIEAARVYSRIHPKRGRPAKLPEAKAQWKLKSSRVVRAATSA